MVALTRPFSLDDVTITGSETRKPIYDADLAAPPTCRSRRVSAKKTQEEGVTIKSRLPKSAPPHIWQTGYTSTSDCSVGSPSIRFLPKF